MASKFQQGSTELTYTGKPVKTAVKLTQGTRVLTADKDYTVTYSDNTMVGIAKITISGKGNYTGTKTLTFKILPEFVTQPETQILYYGDTATFKVGLKGGKFKYRWWVSKDNKNWARTNATGNSTNTLTVKATEGLNGRYYKCCITCNNVTVFSKTVRLVTKNVIVTQPKSTSVKAGTAATFTVNAKGQNVKYQWQYRKSSSGAWSNSKSEGCKTATLTVKTKDIYNGYEYRCAILNNDNYKTYTRPVKLTVK